MSTTSSNPNSEPSSKQSDATRARLKQAKKQKDGAAANENSYPKPKLVLDGDFELVGKHPNKAAYIIMGNNKKYAKPELNITVGVGGPFKAEVDPKTKKPVTYRYPSQLDAASIVMSEATDDTGIVSLKGSPNSRAAIRATADTVKIYGREIVEIGAGGSQYIHGTGTKNKAGRAGQVHIVAGNKNEPGQFELQPMVKGDNLKEYLDQICESISNVNSNQQKIIQSVIKMQAIFTAMGTALTAILPTAGVGSTILSLIAPEIPNAVIALTNNLSSGVNVDMKKFNFTKPYSAKPILSKYNKVN